jgi:Outer membrane protein
MATFAFPLHLRLTLLSGAALALAACSFGPSGEPPAMPQPAHYGAEAQPAQTVPAQGVTQQFVVGAKPVPEWWKLYQSEALNALVDEGLRNSPTLAATDRSLAAAREQLRAQIGSSLLPTIDAGGQATRNRALAIPEAVRIRSCTTSSSVNCRRTTRSTCSAPRVSPTPRSRLA